MSSTQTGAAAGVAAAMRSREQAAALTEAQEGLWYAQQLDPANPIFNTGHCTEIRGELDVALFEQAVNQTLAEADALSLNFADSEQGPRQWLDAARRPRLSRILLDGSAAAAALARRIMLQDLHAPITLQRQPLARHILFSLGKTRHLWYQRVHHLAADGWAMALLEQRAMALYRALRDAQPPGRPLTSFSDVVADDARYRSSDQREQDAAFWREQLAALDSVGSLSEDSAPTGHHILQARSALQPQTIERLQQRQQRSGCAWPAILTALVAAYVQRHTDSPAVVVGVPWMGRMGHVSARSVATVMNVTPLRLNVDQDAALDALLQQCNEQLRELRRHGRYRSEQMRRDLSLAGGQQRIYGPLVNILPFDAAYARAGVDARQEVLCAGPVEDFNFNFRAGPDAAGLRLELAANPRLYDAEQVQAHLDRFIAFLDAALDARTLRTVPTLTAAEHARWVHEVNQTQQPLPQTTLVALTRKACAANSRQVALRMNGRIVRYAEFDALVERAARRLRDAGTRRGDRVAVALPRSVEMVMMLHAIQRAGAAWLPLDVDQPPARTQRILAAAAPRALVGNAATLAAAPPTDGTLLDVDRLFGPPNEADPEEAAPLPEVRPQDAAYVLYTSGSTGEPKGVVVSHRAIVNRLLWMRAHYALGSHNCFLQKTPYTFDVSVWELFLPMLCGAPLVVAAPGLHRDPRAMARLIQEEGVDVVHFVPSMLDAFLDEPASHGLRLAHVFCSGEALPARSRDRFHAQMSAELHNLYGPTEAAVDVSWWPASSNDHSDPVPIGFPVWNTQLYILDAWQRPVPPGVTGTLYLAGVQLADGYLGRPELTAQRFVANPFTSQAGGRMYDTGDLARWRSDGAVEYMGRLDEQVKLRGQRVELGEIESALATSPLCRQVAVAAQRDAAGELRLVAYAAHAQEISHDPQEDSALLLEHARAQLPPFMLPAAVLWLPELPLSRSGKLDVKALPQPQFAPQSARPPRTAYEQRVAQTFVGILGLETQPGADDDFFALGGHSLLAARLAARLREQSGLELTLGAVFEHPTVARLAAWLDHLDGGNTTGTQAGFGPVFTLRPSTAAEGTALFCVHPAGGLAWCYGAMARQLAAEWAVHGLQSPALTQAHHDTGSLDALAQRYVDTLLALQPQGPHHLLGWSVGGIIAQAMACELQRRGLEPGVVALLDAYPSEVWRNKPPAEAGDVWRAILHIAGCDPNALPGLALTQDSVLAFLRKRQHPLGALDDAQFAGIMTSVAYNNQLVRQHQHQRYEGELLFFRAALDHEGENLVPELWQPWAESLSVIDVPALHGHLPGDDALQHWLPRLQARLSAHPNRSLTEAT